MSTFKSNTWGVLATQQDSPSYDKLPQQKPDDQVNATSEISSSDQKTQDITN